MRRKKRLEFLEIKRFGIKKRIAKTEQLISLPGNLSYKEVLPCSQYYDTKKMGYNSKNRLARLIFNRIIKIYIELFIEDLVYSLRAVKLHSSRYRMLFKIILNLNSDTSYLFDSNRMADNIYIKSKMSSFYNNEPYFLDILKGKKLKSKINQACSEGLRYRRQ
jgi:hypothetical protein